LKSKIAAKFLAKLAELPEVDAVKIQQLRVALLGDKKLKADDLVRIFVRRAGGDVK
jgi:hypothetical protein